jgi:hypothetical protein
MTAMVKKPKSVKARLTLTMDKKVIDQAKDFARRNGLSLSIIVERYFRSLVSGSI